MPGTITNCMPYVLTSSPSAIVSGSVPPDVAPPAWSTFLTNQLSGSHAGRHIPSRLSATIS
jgi:hypothetical protein